MPSGEHYSMKKNTNLTQMNLVEATKRTNVALMELINYIHEVNLQIKKKQDRTRENTWKDKLDYFKFCDKEINIIHRSAWFKQLNISHKWWALLFEKDYMAMNQLQQTIIVMIVHC